MEVEEATLDGSRSVKLTRVDLIRRFDDRDRQLNPHRYVGAVDGLGPDWLFVENVAAMLGTTVDFIRRIKRVELPAATVGRRVVYARADVHAYIESRIQRSSRNYVPDRKLRVVTNEADKAEMVSGALSFDPIAKVLALGGGK
ncbi:helix-turn-helix protein [Rhizobium sp. PP-WC-2G-219]|nr:helix-turn-helix protein [Rhizobium sp. PP-WC-2G-219]